MINSVRYVFARKDADTAEAMFRELRDATRREEGVISFDVGRSQEKPNVFVLWEEYQDEAALDAHLGSEHYKRYVINGLRPMAKQRSGEIVFPI